MKTGEAMSFRAWIYSTKVGGFVLLPLAFVTFLAPVDSVVGSVRHVVLMVLVLLGIAGGILGVLHVVGGLQMRCPFCGKGGEVGRSRTYGIWLNCTDCGLVYTTGWLRLTFVRGATTVPYIVDDEDATAPDTVEQKFDLNQPPEGAWFYEDGSGWRIGASTRTAAGGWYCVLACAWSGIFLGLLYGRQVMYGQFHLGATILGIPFVLIAMLFFGIAAMTLRGRIEIRVDGVADYVFFGVGPLGWRRRIDWSEVKRIVEIKVDSRFAEHNGRAICLVGKKRVAFGGFVPDERRRYLLRGLRVLRERAGGQHGDV